MLFLSAVLQRYCRTLYSSSMAFVSYYHQLGPAFYMASYAISRKLHFTLHHDYAYCQKLDCASNSSLGMQLSPALQSPFSFHLGCGYGRKKNKKKQKKQRGVQQSAVVSVAVSSEYCQLVEASSCLEAAERPQWPRVYSLVGPGLAAVCQAQLLVTVARWLEYWAGL